MAPTLKSLEDIQQALENKRKSLGIQPTPSTLYVSIQDHCLFCFTNEHLIKKYTISTSKNPPSCEENSLGTPWGLHKIDGKIGKDAPIGMVFKDREPTGKLYREYPPDDQRLVTTRILRLRGLESGLNSGNCSHKPDHSCDTFDRYIYIHGTPNQKAIGAPQTKGCIVLTNQDVVELFDLVEDGTLVLIDND